MNLICFFFLLKKKPSSYSKVSISLTKLLTIDCHNCLISLRRASFFCRFCSSIILRCSSSASLRFLSAKIFSSSAFLRSSSSIFSNPSLMLLSFWSEHTILNFLAEVAWSSETIGPEIFSTFKIVFPFVYSGDV